MKVKSIVLGAFVLVGAGSLTALAQPSGSYQASCSRIDQRGPFLQAICRDRFGGLVQSRLDLRGCGGDISNNNGRLTCGAGGGGGRGFGRGDDDDDRRRRDFGRGDDRRDRRFEDDRRGRDDRGREFGRRDRDDDDDDRPRRRERRDEFERRY